MIKNNNKDINRNNNLSRQGFQCSSILRTNLANINLIIESLLGIIKMRIKTLVKYTSA